MSERAETSLREMDDWLRRAAIVGPVVAFVLGWGTGILTAAVLYRDHEKRISALEEFQKEQVAIHLIVSNSISRIYEHLHIKPDEDRR
jgi:hypothetical protein